MNGETAARAAAELWRAWNEGTPIDALPADCRPATRAEGYAVQSALLALAGGRSAVWKIAATSVAGQQHIGVDGPLAGRVLPGCVDAPGSTVSLAGNRMRLAEVEFAFRFARRLEPRAEPRTQDEVLAAVDALLPSIELPDSRFASVAGAGAAQLIADNACSWRFVQGPPAPDAWRGMDLAALTPRARVGERYARDGLGSNVLGDPRAALAWFVNELSAQGIAIEAGDVVTTGTCMPPLDVRPGERLVADFGPLGSVDVRFAD